MTKEEDAVVVDSDSLSYESDERMVYYDALQLLRTAARTDRLRGQLLFDAIEEADRQLEKRAEAIRRLLRRLKEVA